MEAESKQERNVHHGHNVRRIRESRGLKQFALAQILKMTQQAVSKIEQKRVIEEKILVKIARALEVPVEVLKEMEDVSGVSYYIENNTFEAKDNAVMGNAGTAGENIYNNYCPFDEIRKLYAEKEALYQQQLKDKQDEINYLRKLLDERK